MIKNFAKLISIVFNPVLLISLVPYILVLKSTNDKNVAVYWTIFSLIFIGILSLFIMLGIKLHYFSDLDISKRSQRPLLFTFSIFLSASYVVFLYLLKAPSILFIAIFALILGLTVFEIANRYTKVSIHVATISAFTTSLFIVYDGIFVLSLFLIPLVSWARIKTHNHTKKQTIIGASLGIVTTLTVYVIFKYIVT